MRMGFPTTHTQKYSTHGHSITQPKYEKKKPMAHCFIALFVSQITFTTYTIVKTARK